jgi:hypothetical protein
MTTPAPDRHAIRQHVQAIAREAEQFAADGSASIGTLRVVRTMTPAEAYP